MSKFTYRLIIYTLMAYIYFSTQLITGYHKEMDDLMRIGMNIVKSCALMSEGEDLESTY